MRQVTTASASAERKASKPGRVKPGKPPVRLYSLAPLIHAPANVTFPSLDARNARICEMIEDGYSLMQAAYHCGTTAWTFLRATDRSDALSQCYTRARVNGANAIVDGMLDHIRGAPVHLPGETDRLRVEIDTRKWYASKLAPKLYGDKLNIEHTGTGGGPIQVIAAAMSASEALAIYIANLRGAAPVPSITDKPSEIIDVKASTGDG